jgi:hypothetical protein
MFRAITATIVSYLAVGSVLSSLPLRKCFVTSDVTLLARFAAFPGLCVAASGRASAGSCHCDGLQSKAMK